MYYGAPYHAIGLLVIYAIYLLLLDLLVYLLSGSATYLLLLGSHALAVGVLMLCTLCCRDVMHCTVSAILHYWYVTAMSHYW